VILSVGTETVENPVDVRRALMDKPEGIIEFKILRDKQEQTLRVQLEKNTNSWLLGPDQDEGITHVAIAPMAIQIPKFKMAPVAIKVPAYSFKPMKIQMPKLQMAPIAIPQVKLAPMKLDIPQVKLAPMKLDIPKFKLEPIKILIVPRRIVL
jgi:hypothetical protein